MRLGMSTRAAQEGSREPYPDSKESRRNQQAMQRLRSFLMTIGDIIRFALSCYHKTIPYCPGIVYLTYYDLSFMV